MRTRRDATNRTPIWVLSEPGVAVRFGDDGPDALVITGTLDSTRLRTIRTSNWDTIDPATTELATWKQVEPPSPEAIMEAQSAMFWRTVSHKWAVREIRERVQDVGEGLDDDERDSVEPVDLFYKTLADVITYISPQMTTSVNKAIAAAFDITPNTAAQYVSRCRKRGYLPPSSRSKR